MARAGIHYFSGSGNTKHMVKVLNEKLENMGFVVTLHNIEKGESNPSEPSDLHIFAFPVYGFAPANIMQKYLKSLNKVTAIKAAVICVCGHTGKAGGYHGQAGHEAKGLLEKKGYDVFCVEYISYPDTWTQVFNGLDALTVKRVVKETDEQVKTIGKTIGVFKRKMNLCHILNWVWSWVVSLMFTWVGRRFLGKCFIADESCNSCGKCAKSCPVKAIQMVKSKPRWKWSCQICNRCMNICPKKAIQTSLIRILLFISAIPLASYLVKEIMMFFIFKQVWLAIFAKILLWLIAYGVLSYIGDAIIAQLERIKYLEKIMALTYTKHYRRYLAPEYQGNAKENVEKII
jgi:flavodoxin/NAD-dependent dihydropyrimidine dehydrogenase PreA subunit